MKHKRSFLAVLLIMAVTTVFAAYARALTVYNCTALTGGAARALDSYSVSNLSDGDRAIVFQSDNWVMFFEYQSSATDAEDTSAHPYRVRPDNYSTAGVWYEQGGDLWIDGSGNLTQDNGVYIASDEVRARDSGGLLLSDDSGTLGVTIADGGNVGIKGAAGTEALTVTGNLMLSGDTNHWIKGDTKDVNDNSAVYFQGAGTASAAVIFIGTGATSYGRLIAIYGGVWADTRIEMSHDGTDGVIESFTGNIKLNSAGTGVYIADGKCLATDEVRARDSGGLYLRDDSGTLGLFVEDGGDVGILIATPTAALDINSDILRLRTAKTPATAGATGNQGDICWDANYIYICVATDTWQRCAISTW